MAEESSAAQAAQASGSSSGGLALYRKYRPATFAEVRGQEHVTDPLRQALKSGRINHAYLFSGPRGCGKTSSARILARSLNCVDGPTPDPCGVCESCVALAPSGPGSIDVIEIDAASHGGVDDARDLRERAFYAPVSGRYKIYIIDEAHMVTSQGFNALLKLVEEPPPHLKFIFATTEPDKVIATIRSRTHHYPFRLMPPSVMSGLCTDILSDEGVSFEPPVIPLVVQAGAGSARDTLSILDQLLAGSDERGIRYDRAAGLLGYTDASLLDEIVAAFARRDGAGVFGVVNRVIEGGHEPRRFTTDVLDRFRDLIVLASVPDAIKTGLLSVPPDREESLAQQAAWGLPELTRAAEIVSNGLDQMRGATSPRLLLELMCAQVLLPAVSSDERSLLVRLERLEAGVSAPVSAPAAAPVSAPAAAPRRLDPSEVPPAPPIPAPVSSAPPVPETAPAAPAESAPRSDPSASQRGAPVSGPRSAARGTSAERRREDSGSERSGGERVSTGGERVSTESIQQDWPQVLDMIKSKRRVAWMMLQNASVVSLDENILMLRFPRQGDVKGFAAGQYDKLLEQALESRYGKKLVVRASSGPDTGPGGGGRRGPAGRGPAPSAPVSPVPAPAAAPAPPAPAPAAPASPEPGPATGGPGTGGVPWPDAPADDEPSPGAGGVGGAEGAPPSWARGEEAGERPRAVDDSDFDPNAEDSSSGSFAPELTGVGLVQKELGGEVIAEFED
ncbi:MAG TPA: DNA polymerase III subunit gamma and tau [Trebonia sp.]